MPVPVLGSPRAADTANSSVRPASRRVLIVDDEPLILDIGRRLLRRFGHAVATAANGAEALGLARAGTFDVIICDLHMPQMSGADLYAALVGQDLLGDALFVVATGAAAEAALSPFVGSAPLPVLLKPFEVASLLDLVSTACRCGDARPGAGPEPEAR